MCFLQIDERFFSKIFGKNYSLLPTLSKILEKLIKTRMIKIFHKYQVLYKFQYGFREKHSVLHALLHVNIFPLGAIQNKQQTALLFMEVFKALDTVSHNILHQKLYHYVIGALHISYLKIISHFETNLYPSKTTTSL